jgi:hypothetical protein
LTGRYTKDDAPHEWRTHHMRMKTAHPGRIANTTAMPLTAAQRAYVEKLNDRGAWLRLEIPPPPTEAGLSYGMKAPRGHLVCIYCSDAFAATAPASSDPDPDNCAVVWDARCGDHDDYALPVRIRGASGAQLHLRVVSAREVLDWPVEQGDRVFIALTEARARQVMLESYDDQLVHNPDGLASAMAKVNQDVSQYIAAGAQWALDRGLPDLAHVTSHMRDEILQRHDAHAVVDAVIDALFGDADAAAPAAAADVHEQYLRVTGMWLASEAARGTDIARGFGLFVGAPGKQLALTGLDHRDRQNNRLTPQQWAESQVQVRNRGDRDGYRYPVIYVAELPAPTANGGGSIQMQVEYMGLRLRIDADGTGPLELDIGSAVTARCVTPDGDASPWVMVEYWPIAAGVQRGKDLARMFVDHHPITADYLQRSIYAVRDVTALARAHFAARPTRPTN